MSHCIQSNMSKKAASKKILQQKLQDGEQKRNAEESRISKEACTRKLLPLRTRCGRSKSKSIKKRSAFVYCRTRSVRIGWQKQNWKHNFGASRQERKEEAAMPRKSSLIAFWTRWWSSFSLWGRSRRSPGSKLGAEGPSKGWRFLQKRRE